MTACTLSPSGEDRLALAALTWLAEDAGPRHVRALTRTCGAANALAMITAGQFPGGLPPQARMALERSRRHLRAVPGRDELAAIFQSGVRLACAGDDDWPSRLYDLGDDAPVALWVRGAAPLAKVARRSVSIIGSRAATAYGASTARDIASTVAARGWTVVSGAAHQGALAAGGTTVAILACGIDRAYPSGHADLIAAIGHAGVIVSEQPPGRPVSRTRFLDRNRVIAASLGVVGDDRGTFLRCCSSWLGAAVAHCATGVVQGV